MEDGGFVEWFPCFFPCPTNDNGSGGGSSRKEVDQLLQIRHIGVGWSPIPGFDPIF